MKEIESLIRRMSQDIKEWMNFAEGMDILSPNALDDSKALVEEAEELLRHW